MEHNIIAPTSTNRLSENPNFIYAVLRNSKRFEGRMAIDGPQSVANIS